LQIGASFAESVKSRLCQQQSLIDSCCSNALAQRFDGTNFCGPQSTYLAAASSFETLFHAKYLEQLNSQ